MAVALSSMPCLLGIFIYFVRIGFFMPVVRVVKNWGISGHKYPHLLDYLIQAILDKS